MIYRDFLGNKVSLLGMGAMRLPVHADGTVNEEQTREMVEYAMAHGINYFDTAWPYHGGHSEKVLGRILKDYPRESFYLADKFPGHQIHTQGYHPAQKFEAQLEACGVEYFDYYLLHNVYENSIDVYMDPQWDIVNYFREQKRLGRIKHLGFSTHGSVEVMKKFLDYCEGDMEFCQIQMNYLDWTLQNAAEKYKLLTERGIPVVVMEPVRGGRLVNLSEKEMEGLRAARPEASAADWAMRFFRSPMLGNLATVLTGASSLQQFMENTAAFEEGEVLTAEEMEVLFAAAEGMKDGVPCTACKYCVDGCPMGLDIPLFLSIYNELKVQPAMTVAMRAEWQPDDKKPSACTACGKCSKICPQHIDIPARLAELTEMMKPIPKWADACWQREQLQG